MTPIDHLHHLNLNLNYDKLRLKICKYCAKFVTEL